MAFANKRVLHWLALPQRIRFKLAGFVFRHLPAVPRRRLPSSIAHWPSSSLCWHQNLCRSPNKHSVHFLKFRSKTTWNSLPSALRQP